MYDNLLVRSFPGMCANMFLKVTESGEVFRAAPRFTVESGTIVKPLVSTEPV